MRLGGEEGFGKPSAVEDLTDVPKFKEFCNCRLDDWEFARSKSRVLTGNRPRVPSVDFTLIVFDWNRDALFRKDTPVLFDEVK